MIAKIRKENIYKKAKGYINMMMVGGKFPGDS